MTERLKGNVDRYFRDRYPEIATMQLEYTLRVDNTNIPVDGIVAMDYQSLVAYRVLALKNLGGHGPHEFDSLLWFHADLIRQYHGMEIQTGIQHKRLRSNKGMVGSPTLILYTDHTAQDPEAIATYFYNAGFEVAIISEEKMHQSAFISYGGPDERMAEQINAYLTGKGVKTWFFPIHKLPGEKLHRTMSNGVSTHDRVILVCSRSSLQRPGVLNEIERVLEREAREGGSEILIPVAIDEYLFSTDFKPSRPDIADQIRSRVSAVIPAAASDPQGFDREMARVLAALKRAGA